MRFCFGDAPKTEAAAERMLENIATTPRAEGLALAVFDATPRSCITRSILASSHHGANLAEIYRRLCYLTTV